MATVLTCRQCHYPISFKDVIPGETKTVDCPNCGTSYGVSVTYVHGPTVNRDTLRQLAVKQA